MTDKEALQYSINGDRVGYLEQSLKEKLSIKNPMGVLTITKEEFHAWFSMNKAVGGSDGRF